MHRIIFLGIFLLATVNSATISNEIVETPRIHDGEELVSLIIRDCFDFDGMSCLKGKVLTYLDTVLGLQTESARSYDEKNVDRAIYDRASRLLKTYEFRVELPKLLFGDVVAAYRTDRGIDFLISQKHEGMK